MIKHNKRFLLLTFGIAVLLIGGGIAAYSLLVQRFLFLENAPVGTQLVPQDALLTVSVSTDTAQWQQLQQYGTPETRAVLEKQLTQLRQNLLSANGYNYEKDIQPSLGETFVIAYLGSGTSTSGREQKQQPWPGIPFNQSPDLIVLPMANPVQAKQLLDKAKSQKVAQVVERTYKGVQISETQKNGVLNNSAAALGRFLVVTKNPKTTEQVIDTYKGAASVAATPGYIEKLGKIDAPTPFARAYLNVPSLTAAAAANSTRSRSPEQLADQEQRQGVATTVTLEPEGIRFQSVSWLKPKSERKYKVKNTANRLPRQLPANTLLALSGGNLAQLWQDYVQGAASNPLAPNFPANVSAGLQATLGLDLEEDLLPLMGSEFAVALIPASEDMLKLPENLQPLPTLGAGVVLMFLSSDRSRTEKIFQHLDNVMETRYQFLVEKTQLNGQPVVNWTSPLAGVSATHGWLEGNIAFLTLGAPIASAIVPQPPATLIQTSLFQQVVPDRINPRNGMFFLDIERTFNRGNLNLPELPSEPKSLLQAIRAIGFAVAINDERTTRFDMFVKLKKAIAPSASPAPDKKPSTPSSPKPAQTPQTPRSPSSPSP